MTNHSTRACALAAGMLGLALAASAAQAQAQAGDGALYISAKDLHAKVAKTTDGLATTNVPTGPDGVVVMARREKTGEVEVHTRMHDEFVVRQGRAAVLVGGKVEGGRETGPNEWRGGKIVGGRQIEVGPGDMLWIPAGTPHQVIVPAGGDFYYMAVKFEAKGPAGK